MSRKPRFIPEGGALVKVTCRTIKGRLLMCPSPQFNEIILGVLGRTQSRYPWRLSAMSSPRPAFREAADRLKAGDRNAELPIGSSPPRLPFVKV